MAAEAVSDAGHSVLVADQKSSFGRKFLMAGKSGLNLTKDVSVEDLLSVYGGSVDLTTALGRFGVGEVCGFAANLGQDIFVGSSNRVFPTAMKASPMLRAWLKRLTRKGVRFEANWQMTSIDPLTFDTPLGPVKPLAHATVLALGGGSWIRLGSDGVWQSILGQNGVQLVPMAPVNVGLTVDWSAHMQPHFGSPLKAIVLSAGHVAVSAEAVVTRGGLEGGGVYEVSGQVVRGSPLALDLMPDWSIERLRAVLAKRGKASWGSFLRKALRWGPVKQALFMEMARPVPTDPAELIKALPIPVLGPYPMDGAISTSGGVAKDALDGFMLHALPGVFCAGEMLDWDAPTGGYLITGCLASGLAAGQQAAVWLSSVQASQDG